MFKLKNFKAVTTPTRRGKDDDFNGIAEIESSTGTRFNVWSDPTPPRSVIDFLKRYKARGLTDVNNPWWTYNCPACDPSTTSTSYGRPAEVRYPELYLNISFAERVQIHELGVALSAIRNRDFAPPVPYLKFPDLDDNDLYPHGHDDDGPALEDCVGRKYFSALGFKPRY
jgi:hypothetical protein